MSKQKNRHRRHKPDGTVIQTETKQEQTDNQNHHAKSVVSTNVTKHTQNQENQTKKVDNQNSTSNKSENNDFAHRNRQNNQNRRNKNKNRKKKKNTNNKLRNVKPEDLFQLKDPKRAKLLQNKKARPRNFIPYKIQKAESTVCPICNQQIGNMCDTIFDTQTNKNAHFECVYNRLNQSLKLKEGQRLAYLGSGTFAIIEDVQTPDVPGKPRFVIKEKISHL